MKTKGNGVSNSRFISWLYYLNMFDFNTELHNGYSGEIVLADCLSRMFEQTSTVVEITLIRVPFWTSSAMPLVEYSEEHKLDLNLINQSEC